MSETNIRGWNDSVVQFVREVRSKSLPDTIQMLQCKGSSDGLGALKKRSPAEYDLCAGVNTFFTCPCFSSAHLLHCWGISLGQLFEDQDLMCDIIMRKGQMNLVYSFLIQGDFKQQQRIVGFSHNEHYGRIFKGRHWPTICLARYDNDEDD
ncbi:hypothetical protein TNCV_4629441 [Trichonephila clavipes]|nr:hypothetical protein TNCV_4629441 [Trichonephila clavipes]